MPLLPIFSSPLIGLDIQPRGLNLIQLKPSRAGFRFVRWATSELPSTLFTDGKIKHWDQLSTHLSQLVRQFKLQGMATALAVPAAQVRFQHLHLPMGLPDEAIEMEIAAQVKRDLPGMSEALCMDFVQFPAVQPDYMDVCFVVARQDYINQYVACVNAAGLVVKIVDVDLYALVRAVNDVLPSEQAAGQFHGIFLADDTSAILVIYKGREIFFHAQWDAVDAHEFGARLKNQLQLCRARLGNIRLNRLSICCAESQRERWKNEFDATWTLTTDYPDPYTHFPAAQISNKDNPALLIAYGAAMREVPRW